MQHFPRQVRPGYQSGVALIAGLIFLLVLTMIGATSALMSGLEERMSSNMRDREIAMQAAELALRDAERDIKGLGTNPRNPPISGITGFFATCDEDGAHGSADDGLCDRRGMGETYTPKAVKWTGFTGKTTGEVFADLEIDMTDWPSVSYGAYTGAAPIQWDSNGDGVADTGLSAQPRYLIEGIQRTNPPGLGGNTFYYRITVRAQGVSPNTVVWLQETFKPK